MNQVESAYLAGLVDGEGYVGAVEVKTGRNAAGYLCSPHFSLRLNITNTSERMIAWIQQRAKGLVSVKSRAGQWKSTKTCYRWQVRAGRAVSVLREIHPYLVVKKDQADLVFKLKNIQMNRDPEITHCAPTRLTDDELAERRDIVNELKAVKKSQGELIPRKIPNEITASPIEWSYLAGIFDGEGCVNAVECKPNRKNKSPRFRIRVQITNSSEHLINWMVERFGGTIHLVGRAGKGLATRNCWVLIWSPNKGEALLRGMYPYLTTKKAQAELAFRLRALVRSKDSRIQGFAPGVTLDSESISARRELVQALKDAKKIQ